MNQQLQEALAIIINKAVASLDTAVSFLSAELPDAIHQLFIWKLTISLIDCGISISIIGICVYILHRQWKYWTTVEEGMKYPRHHYNDGIFICNLFFLVPIGVGMCFFNFTWLKIWIAPKIWLIEYVASLTK